MSSDTTFAEMKSSESICSSLANYVLPSLQDSFLLPTPLTTRNDLEPSALDHTFLSAPPFGYSVASDWGSQRPAQHSLFHELEVHGSQNSDLVHSEGHPTNRQHHNTLSGLSTDVYPASDSLLRALREFDEGQNGVALQPFQALSDSRLLPPGQSAQLMNAQHEGRLPDVSPAVYTNLHDDIDIDSDDLIKFDDEYGFFMQDMTDDLNRADSNGNYSTHGPPSSSSVNCALDADQPGNHGRHHTGQRRAANTRERRRMKIINKAFQNLRKHVPCESYEKKLSKVDTLKSAIDYISFMTNLLKSNEGNEKQTPIKRVVVYTAKGQHADFIGHSLSWDWDKSEIERNVDGRTTGSDVTNTPQYARQTKHKRRKIVHAPIWRPRFPGDKTEPKTPESQAHCKASPSTIKSSWQPLHNDSLYPIYKDTGTSEMEFPVSSETFVPLSSMMYDGDVLKRFGQYHTQVCENTIDRANVNVRPDLCSSFFAESRLPSISSLVLPRYPADGDSHVGSGVYEGHQLDDSLSPVRGSSPLDICSEQNALWSASMKGLSVAQTPVPTI